MDDPDAETRPTAWPSGTGQEAVAARDGRGRSRWLGVAALVLIGIGAVALWTFEGPGLTPIDDRAGAITLTERDLAAGASMSGLRRTSPPVDVKSVERGARAATFNQVALPNSEQVSTFQRIDTGEEITHAVLVYDDVSKAAQLDRLAGPLLSSVFGLTDAPLDLEGTQDARRWTGGGYQVATFRIDGVVMVIATTSADPSDLERLAAMARDKAQGVTAVTATAEARPPNDGPP